MKRNLFFTALLAGCFLSCAAKGETSSNQEVATNEGEASVVYFTKEITPEALVKIYEQLGVPPTGKVAVKISTGESEKSYPLSPDLIKDLVQKVDGTLVECNTLYTGNRHNGKVHRQAVAKRGYDKIAPVDIMDEDAQIAIAVNDSTWIHYDLVGANLPNYDYMINLAHFKGHQMGGFGGVLKNASIGVASSNGKAYIHSAGKVTEGWGQPESQDAFLESMAAAAQAVHNYFKQPGKDIVYINVMNNMSIDCDCNGNPSAPVLANMGILASTDPVALDQACVDLVFNHQSTEGDDSAPLVKRINQMHGTHTIDHAAKIGLGTKNYKIVSID
ncbi:MAG: DUF362 domain-containing protein [Muribaculaceae bacterium]|nr:DUF362 domain-containing protein [Muribaculaceae bacterium]